MNIIDGKKIADEILDSLKKEIKKRFLKPCLGIILAGDDSASLLYIQKKEESSRRIGIEIRKHILSKDVSEEEILKIINSLNHDKQINGILIQMPLPKDISPDRIVQAIDPKKDVDGFLFKSNFDSPFVLAIQKALKATEEDLENKKIIALVNTDAFKKIAERIIKADYLIGFNKGFVADLKKADIIITALGQPNAIKSSMIKENVILIDGGISRKNGKIIGDIDKESVKEKAKWLSPVPGGIGPITVAFLLKNVVLSIK